jgi:hypothetical protein
MHEKFCYQMGSPMNTFLNLDFFGFFSKKNCQDKQSEAKVLYGCYLQSWSHCFFFIFYFSLFIWGIYPCKVNVHMAQLNITEDLY